METVNEGKEKLKRALLEVCARYAENAELAPKEEAYLSPRLTKNMGKLMKDRAKSYWKLVNTAAKRAVAACLAAVILAGAMMSCRPVREKVFDFFRNVYEAYTEIFFGDEARRDAPKVIEEIHMPAYIPEGYEMVKEPEIEPNDYRVYSEWRNSEGSYIKLYQNLLSTKTVLDTESADVELLDDMRAMIVSKGNDIIVIWKGDEYAYRIASTGLDKEEVLNIIKSIEY